MSYALKIHPNDRPGWIPFHLKIHWDTDPYAYQTEEEQMPAGGPHNLLLAHLMEVLNYPLKRQQQMLLLDPFLLYRDPNGIKQRIAPDLLLMPWRDEAPAAYDLDVEAPPVLVAEVTSPRSQLTDLTDKGPFYFGLGVQAYLVIDAFTIKGQPRKRIQVHLWRMVNGQIVKITPDANGCLAIPELGVSLWVWGRRFRFIDLATGDVLPYLEELTRLRNQEARRAQEQTQRADAEARRAEEQTQRAIEEARRAQEQTQRAIEEARRAQEQTQRADAEARRAEEQTQRAIEEAGRADAEAVARHAAEAELARMKAWLTQLGYPTT